jgi:type I restriction enzyme M protein
VKHDLFNHDGLTQDGIAEAFIEFAKKENLSFFNSDLQDLKNYSPRTKNTSEKSFKSSFVASGRLDAEYYHPKFDELEEKIAKVHKIR